MFQHLGVGFNSRPDDRQGEFLFLWIMEAALAAIPTYLVVVNDIPHVMAMILAGAVEAAAGEGFAAEEAGGPQLVGLAEGVVADFHVE